MLCNQPFALFTKLRTVKDLASWFAMKAASHTFLRPAHIIDPTLPNGDEIDVTFFPKGKSRADVAPIKATLDPKSRMPDEDLAVIRVALKKPPPGVLPLCPKEQAPSAVFRSTPERDGPPPPNQPLSVLTVGMGPLGTPGTHCRSHSRPSIPF